MRARLIATLLFSSWGVALDPLVLENPYLRVTVDSAHGSVSSLVYKQAISFPYIAAKGAGVAGKGRLFEPVLWIGDRRLTPAFTLNSRKSGEIIFTCQTENLKITRILRLDPAGTSINISDEFHNRGRAAEMVRAGGTGSQDRESWSLTSRSWSRTPGEWRYIGQYGLGLVYTAPPRAELSSSPEGFSWQSPAVKLAPSSTVSFDSSVQILEGGSGRAEAFADGLLADADFAEAGSLNRPVRGFARLISSRSRQVQLVVSQLGSSERQIITLPASLQPGKEFVAPFTVVPAATGPLEIEVAALDGSGRKMVSTRGRAAIEQPGPAWDLYTRAMPEEIYSGSWEHIGKQVAGNLHRIGAPTSLQLAKRKDSHPSQFSFYEKRFPFYADMLRGAAKEMHTEPERIARLLPEAPGGEACMNIAFNGPDGPLNAFSKERSGPGVKGLGYQKVTPTQGFPFHIYMMYGVNSEGLSTSGATLNENSATAREGARQATEWKASGKPVMPSSAAMWMILAMCRNVQEALALIESKDAPLEFTGTMMLLDRAGNSARVESSGILRQVFRSQQGDGRFFVAGNYPHARPDGLFSIGERWGWAANTMLREYTLARTVGSRLGRLSLDDVFSIMQSHGPGGMCQHIDDNPGLLYTSCSYIAVTRTSELWLAHGPPCQVRYVRYGL